MGRSGTLPYPGIQVDEYINKKKRTTRDIILHSIKRSPQSTVEELALVADVSPVTVRHHLNALQADGTIEATSIRRKVGRPYYVYSLSPRGHELFPKRYVQLTNRLLGELKGRLPQDAIDEIFEGVVETVLKDHRGEFEHLPLEERLDYLTELLSEEGFLATWERTSNGYRLVEYSCPYLSIGSTHEEVCHFDRRLITGVMQLQVNQDSCMLHGASCCQFTIAEEDPAELSRPEAATYLLELN